MGYIEHQAVIVTTWEEDRFWEFKRKVHEQMPRSAVRRFCAIPSTANVYMTYILAPDGSKEGWGTSDEGDAERALFIKLALEVFKWPDIVELTYGGDRFDNGIPAEAREISTRDEGRSEM